MRVGILLALARPWAGRLALVAGLMLLESLALLAVPWVLGQLAGGLLIPEGPAPGMLALGLVGLLVVIAALRIAVALLSGGTAIRLLAQLRRRVHDHLQALPLPFHENHRGGDLLALSTWEIARLSDFLTSTLVGLVPLALTAAGAIILMFRIDPVLALMVPVLVPGFYLVLKVIGRRLRALGLAAQAAAAETVAIAEEHLDMLPAIKSFTREGIASRRYGAVVDRLRDITLAENRIYAVMGPVIQLVAAGAAVALLMLAGASLRAGDLSAPDLVAFLLYAALLTRPVAALANVYGQVQSLRGTLARLATVLDTATEPGDDTGLPLDRATGALHLAGVGFAYPGRAGTLDGIDLDIPAGQTLAVTGPNGAGKSTLIALLLRLRSPDRGTIRLDGIDIATLRLSDLRRQIGVVPQRPLLFDATVAQNIGFGAPAPSPDQIRAAARLAQAHDFVMDLPQGYDTLIGDKGVRLSGGQQQRIALARALLKDPPILILDEATSMYDLEGEAAFVADCRAALAGRTVILITHRPATLALADRTLRLEAGRIVADRSAA